ncbi:MAG: DUF4340 domain-containing protein [Armatimonadota bacterium]|nr:DUF4340 domain-containing protein [Armatimonadota bacterium]
MNTGKTIWVVAIAAALGLYIAFFERGKAPEEGGARQLQQVLGYQSDRVWKLQLDRKDDPLWVTREKDARGEAWRIEKPVSAAADGAETKRIIEELSTCMVDRVLREDIKDLKPFGLDHPSWELTISIDNGTKHTLLVGGKDPGNTSLYVKPKDRDEILVLPAWSLEALQNKKADDLRDKSVIAFKKDDVQRFELVSGGKSIMVERAGPDEWRITAPVKAKARKERANAILMTFENLKGTRVVEDNPKDLKKYELDPPKAKVSVWVKGRKDPLVALLGGKDSSGDLWAKGEHNPSVVTVYSYVMNDAETKLEDLKEPEPVKEEKKEEKKPANAPANVPPPPGTNAPAANAPGANEPANLPTIDKPIKAKPADKK